jgi:hypothetical protein
LPCRSILNLPLISHRRQHLLVFCLRILYILKIRQQFPLLFNVLLFWNTEEREYVLNLWVVDCLVHNFRFSIAHTVYFQDIEHMFSLWFHCSCCIVTRFSGEMFMPSNLCQFCIALITSDMQFWVYVGVANPIFGLLLVWKFHFVM